MNAHRRIYVRIAFRQRDGGAARSRIRRQRQHARHARFYRALYHRVAVGVKLRVGEVTVRVEKYQGSSIK